MSLGVEIDLSGIEEFAERSEREINRIYSELPPEAKEHLDKLKRVNHTYPAHSETITEDDKWKILDNVDKLFKKNAKDDEN